MSAEIVPSTPSYEQFAVTADQFANVSPADLPATLSSPHEIVDAEIVPGSGGKDQLLESLTEIYHGTIPYLLQTRSMLGEGVDDAATEIVRRVEKSRGNSLEALVANPDASLVVVKGVKDMVDLLETRLRSHHPQAKEFLSELAEQLKNSVTHNRHERVIKSEQRRVAAIEKANSVFAEKRQVLLNERQVSELELAKMKGVLQIAQGKLVTELPLYREILAPLVELYKKEDSTNASIKTDERMVELYRRDADLLKLKISQLQKDSVTSAVPNNILESEPDFNDPKFLLAVQLTEKEEAIERRNTTIEGYKQELKKLESSIYPYKRDDMTARRVQDKIFNEFQSTLLKKDQVKVIELLEELKDWTPEQRTEFARFDPNNEQLNAASGPHHPALRGEYSEYIQKEARLNLLAIEHLGETPNVDDRCPLQVENFMVLALEVIETRLNAINDMYLKLDKDFTEKSIALLEEKERSILEAQKYHQKQITTVQGLEEHNRQRLSKAFENTLALVGQDDREIQNRINELNGLLAQILSDVELKRAKLNAIALHETERSEVEAHRKAFEDSKNLSAQGIDACLDDLHTFRDGAVHMYEADGQNAFDPMNAAKIAATKAAALFADALSANGAHRQEAIFGASVSRREELREQLIAEIIVIDERINPIVDELMKSLRTSSDVGTSSHEAIYALLDQVTPVLDTLFNQEVVTSNDVIAALAPGLERTLRRSDTESSRRRANRIAAEALKLATYERIQSFESLSRFKKWCVYLGLIQDPRLVPIDVEDSVEQVLSANPNGGQLQLESGK